MNNSIHTSILFALVAATASYLLFDDFCLYLSSCARRTFIGKRAGSIPVHRSQTADSQNQRAWLPASIRNLSEETSLEGTAILVFYSSLAAGAVVAAALAVDGYPGVAVGSLGLGLGLPYVLLRRNWLATRSALKEGLPAVLTMLAGALSAGMSLGQSLTYASSRLPGSLGRHLGEIARQQQLGVEFDESLRRLRDRLNLPELDSVLVGIAIQRRTGGDLAGMLEHMALIIKQRLLLQRKTCVTTAQTRFSGKVIGTLPLGVTALILAVDPSFLAPMLSTIAGWTMLTLAALAEVLGLVLIGRIATIDV